MNNKEFKIPPYIATGDVNSTDTTSFRNGDILDFHKGRDDLKPVSEIHTEAMNFAAEVPKPSEVSLFEQIGETLEMEIKLSGKKSVEMRIAESKGAEVEALTVSTLALQRNLDEKQFGLAA